MIMKWFNVEKVEQPSEEPPLSKPVRILYGEVMEKDDIAFYRLFDYGSVIYIYDMPTNYFFFLARQHAYDRRTRTFALHAEYRLTLTDDAKKIVNELLSKPFQCEVDIQRDVEEQHAGGKGNTHYKCITYHSVSIPDPNTAKVYQGQWTISVFIEKGVIERVFPTTIPFNCGPLRPLWKKAVECWIKELATTTAHKIYPDSKRVDLKRINAKLLEYKYLATYIIPTYRI